MQLDRASWALRLDAGAEQIRRGDLASACGGGRRRATVPGAQRSGLASCQNARLDGPASRGGSRDPRTWNCSRQGDHQLARGLFHEANLMMAVEAHQGRGVCRGPCAGRGKRGSGRNGSAPASPTMLISTEDWLTAHCQLGLKASDEARRALEKILAYRAVGPGDEQGRIIRAGTQATRTHAGRRTLLKSGSSKTPKTPWPGGPGPVRGTARPCPPRRESLRCRVLAALAG